MENLVMSPAPGDRLLRFVGDNLRFSLRMPDGGRVPEGWRALLRTNLGRAAAVREEIIHSYFRKLPLAGASWTDLPLSMSDDGWSIEVPLAEVGFFRAKAYAIDPHGHQHWPQGDDFGVTVHPDAYRTANTIYCAFIRLFGAARGITTARSDLLEQQLAQLDQQGYAVIPPSGKIRDLIRQLPHIFETLGCRILHLLPVSPTPTTMARMGRFGSPYACLDLTGIDPALVEFDRRTTGVDQFRELTQAIHLFGGKVFLDLVINHTGWGATLQENHPEWYLRGPDGKFVCPGAWDVVWEDLVELEHRHAALWDYLAEVFLTWCRRGVDGFRCDAGYKVPVPAWQYIVARVRQEFPEALFLLEGLGGPWDVTESLLTDGGMQWAYSELFQNYSGTEVSAYLDYCLRQNQRVGVYVNYSETHDNHRLASTGRTWSLLRNRLCALTSVCGGFGFTCGVEWLATEKVNVHHCGGLAWGQQENICAELSHLNRLLANHPCFFDGAVLRRLSEPDSSVYALSRESADGLDHVLVLINLDVYNARHFSLEEAAFQELGAPSINLLGQGAASISRSEPGPVKFTLRPAEGLCLAPSLRPHGLSGGDYRKARAQAAWAVTAFHAILPIENMGTFNWRDLAALVAADPKGMLCMLSRIDPAVARNDLVAALSAAREEHAYEPVVVWGADDARRVTLVPPHHWLLIEDTMPFQVTFSMATVKPSINVASIEVHSGHVACIPPTGHPGEGSLILERFAEENVRIEARFLRLSAAPDLGVRDPASGIVLLTNGIGGMARLAVDLGRIQSKYDCALGANLLSNVPADRHVFVKRVRVWVNADGFISPLNADNLVEFSAGPPAQWRFVANAGDGRSVEVRLAADMLEGRNTTVLEFSRSPLPPAVGKDLPFRCDVRLTLRPDLEDRNFHWETKYNEDAERHFSANVRALPDRCGFEFQPAPDRRLWVCVDQGRYHHQPEWSRDIPHPVEKTRGQTASGDAYSPGWFEVPLPRDSSVALVLSADPSIPGIEETRSFAARRSHANRLAIERSQMPENDAFGRQLALASQAYVVRRDEGKTVIAGYPWFLDWGRDSLICARGMLAAGMIEEVRQLLMLFGRFEFDGTLPNTIHGADASNRDTSDAPLWYGIACEEIARHLGPGIYSQAVDTGGRTIADVLRVIARSYRKGTPNGVRMDPASGLIWSPSHFTWMDTNFPAGTPREGYPVEIQVLWIRLLRQLDRIKSPGETTDWGDLAHRAESSLLEYFWLERRGYFADLVIARAFQPAAEGTADNALRSNCLLAVTLGVAEGDRARQCVMAAQRHLVVPGALRSLAPLPVEPPLAIYGHHGILLNHPPEPYWGHYEGDEDTRRKPAYHNGTAWTWTFPSFCEALVMAWDFSPAAVAAAKAYLASMDRLITEGCLGHLPEILDGDAPHQQRGCDAQAWGATEALRVWKILQSAGEPGMAAGSPSSRSQPRGPRRVTGDDVAGGRMVGWSED